MEDYPLFRICFTLETDCNDIYHKITLRHSHYVLLTVLFNGSCRAKWWLLNIHLRNNYRFNENTLIYFLFKV